MQIGLEISYTPVFNSAAPPQSFNNLVYDRTGVLFNLASLYSQLAALEDRSTPSGLKQAIKFYQASSVSIAIPPTLIIFFLLRKSAAGTLNILAGSAVPQLQASLLPVNPPSELTEHFVKSLENLMLAQAQECVWQRAVMGEKLQLFTRPHSANFN